MKKAKLVGALVAVVLSLVLILQNTQTVDIRFLFFSVTMPNAVLVGFTLLIGIALGILVAFVISSRRVASRKE